MSRLLSLLLLGLVPLGCGHPNEDRAHEKYLQGLTLARNKETEQAILAFSAAIRLSPNYANAYVNRGFQYDELDQAEKAIADFSAAIRLNPKYAKAYYNRGTVYLRRKEYDRSIVDFTRTIQLTPKDGDAYHNRGNAHRKKEEYALAFRDYSKALEINRNDGLAYYNRALTCLQAAGSGTEVHASSQKQQNNYTHAIADLSNFLKLHPRVASAFQLRGIAYRENGDTEKATADFRQAEKLRGGQSNPQPTAVPTNEP
ncbi:MAG: tetratricopeptide repeat protein [Planctomycetota bacterium]|nr:tetratricopeptide repeat protein [Planctomycetota bacterium]